MSRVFVGHRGVVKAVVAHLQTNVPVQLANMRAADSSVLVPDPVQWLAHERFAGDSGANKTTTPVVMVTTDGVARVLAADTTRPGDGVDYDGPEHMVDYLVRVIVGVHAPGRGGTYQDVYDARSDLLLAVRNSVLLHNAITANGSIAAHHDGMTELLYTPADPETVRSYLEGQIAFRVRSYERVGLPMLGTVAATNVTVSTGPFPA